MYRIYNTKHGHGIDISYIINIESTKFDITVLEKKLNIDINNITLGTREIVVGKDIDNTLGDDYYLKYKTRTFTLEDLNKYTEWKDYSVWSPIIDIGEVKGIINKFAESFSIRRTSPNTNELFSKFFPFDIIVPNKNCNFDEMHFFIYKHPDSKIISNKNFIEYKDIDTVESDKKELLPYISISGSDVINKDSYSTLTLDVTNYNLNYPLTIELELINGYLPKSRIITKDTATFKVYSTGLDSGDTIKIKAGFRYYSSLAEKEIKVI